MNRDISIYLKDILENMERAERFVEGKKYEDFIKDEIIHFYFGVSLERVWLVVKENIPQIKPHIRKALEYH